MARSVVIPSDSHERALQAPVASDSPPKWRLSLLEDPFMFNPTSHGGDKPGAHSVWIRTSKSLDGVAPGGLWLPDDVLGEILMYLDEFGSGGLQTLLNVSAVSSSWRAVANRLPQWSALVRASQLPCPTFERAAFTGTRNAVFRPYIQAAARQHRSIGGLRGVCFPILLFFFSLMAILFGVLMIATHEDRVFLRPRYPFDFGMGWHDPTGKPALCRETSACVPMEDVIDGVNKSTPYLTIRQIQKHFYIPQRFIEAADNPVPNLAWLCPTKTYVDDLHFIFSLKAVSTLLLLLAIPVVMILGSIYARAKSKAWQRLSAIGITVATLFCVASTTTFCVGSAMFYRFVNTPCDAHHPALSKGNVVGTMGAFFAIFTGCLILCTTGASIHALCIARLWSNNYDDRGCRDLLAELWRKGGPTETPEGAEVPPNSVDPKLAVQHDVWMRFAILIRDTQSGTFIGTHWVSVLYERPKKGDSPQENAYHRFELQSFNRRSLTMHLRHHHQHQAPDVVDIGLGHWLNPKFPLGF